MEAVTIRIRKRWYEVLSAAVGDLLADYDVEKSPSDEFDVETLETVTDFEEFAILRDFAIELGDARPVEQPNTVDAIEIEVHAHHLIALVAAFPDLVGATDIPEADLLVIVEGLCHAYLVDEPLFPSGDGPT